jgi:DNA polymerase-3 subunit alpha
MICQELCGYNLGEGDVLRRIIGKKKEKEMRPALDDFINRGIMNGIPREIMIKISEQIETFALYGFNMGHSAAYGYTAYQTAYLKAHYPLQFWKARLNMCIGKVERTVQYIESARNDGIEILPPSVMESDHIWKIESTKLRMALNCVKGIKLQNMDNFVRQPDIISFINNNSLNKRILEGLAKSGCFGEKVGENLSIIDWKKLQKTGPKKSQNMTFETYISQFPINETDLSISQIEVLGMTFVKNIFEKFDLSLVNGATISYGLCVSFKSRLDKNGRKMAFVGMTDKNGTKEYVMFWRNFRELKTGTVYLFNHNKTIITDITQPRLLTKR